MDVEVGVSAFVVVGFAGRRARSIERCTAAMRYRGDMAARRLPRPAAISGRGRARRPVGSGLGAVLCVLAACARTPVVLPAEDDAGPAEASEERCNLLDDDLDWVVDEEFRDVDGNYVHIEHCGGCDRACDAPIANAELVICAL